MKISDSAGEIFSGEGKMKNLIFFIILILTLTGINFVRAASAQDNFKIEKIKPNVVRISGAKDALFSPSGKFLAVQASSYFYLLPVQNIDKSLENAAAAHKYDGLAIGFLPSETLIYSNSQGVFALESLKPNEGRKLFSPDSAKLLIELEDLRRKEVVIASNDLIITGDGHYDWGTEKGNIY